MDAEYCSDDRALHVFFHGDGGQRIAKYEAERAINESGESAGRGDYKSQISSVMEGETE